MNPKEVSIAIPKLCELISLPIYISHIYFVSYTRNPFQSISFQYPNQIPGWYLLNERTVMNLFKLKSSTNILRLIPT